MILIFVFLFILFQACGPTQIINSSNPETKDYWIQFLFREGVDFETEVKTGAEIEDETETTSFGSFRKNLNALELEWSLLVGAPNAISGASVGFAVDKNDFSYVAGTTDGAVYNPSRIGIRDIILGKYDSNKNPIWTKQIGVPAGVLDVTGVALDPNGNAYVIGNTKGNFVSPRASGQDMFVIKFDSEGTQVWTQQTGAKGVSYLTYSTGIAVDTFGNSYIVGNSIGPFGGPKSGLNSFILKFDTDGNQIWVKQVSITRGQVHPGGVAVDKVTGNIYTTNQVKGNFATDSIPGIGNFDLLILKYDPDGNRQVFAQLGLALRTIEGKSISIDPSGNVFVGGSSNANLESNSETGKNFRGTLVKYDSSGVQQWIKQFGPTDDDAQKQTVINTILTDASGNVFMTGWTSGNIIDGVNGSYGKQDVFLTKHGVLGEIVWARQIGTPDVSMYGVGIGLDLKGNLYCSGTTDGTVNEIPSRGFQDLFVLKYK
ncbi:SBBP repeat beta-propeller lipoprotein, LipL53 family [Leptospira alstonii]|uniref:Beta-propeller repeat protein n=2 Tax=Leptospira alstonii TaxID=28452 RepID=M6D124_9LEPT|nr:SBBP repeat-containing protein [Leptospira alstonii]EMJ97664.1 beta-propeller repeat protein [Leptospira alstonii serovar Sichuan str. 79601]EQA79387.1 beta-propeller repeat protein [Leptospira alstonii serovar Pingchang str. 80-412]